MNYLKSLALLLLSTSILTSCSEDEYFTDVYSMKDTEANLKDTKATETDTTGTEPNDSTESGMISINFDEPEVVDIDFVITLP